MNTTTTFCVNAPGVTYQVVGVLDELVRVEREGKGDHLTFELSPAQRRPTPVYQGYDVVATVGRDREGDWYVKHNGRPEQYVGRDIEDAIIELAFLHLS